MPPTTGGSTNGSSTSERTMPCPRKLVRARTTAIGTPNRMQRRVLVLEVRRLSSRASRDASEVMSSKKRLQGVRATMATSGSSTKAAPTKAGTKSQAGTPTRSRGSATSGRRREAGVLQDRLSGLAEHQVDELLGEVDLLGF